MKKFYFTLVTFLFLAVANAQIVNIPDANFKAKLLSASPFNSVASVQTPNNNGSVSIYHKIDTNNDGEIQISEAVLIKFLSVSEVSVSNLEGINSFANLQSLNFNFFSALTVLDLSNLVNLQILRLINCDIQTINLENLISLQELQFSYVNSLVNINASGLINLKGLYCYGGILQNLDVSGLNNLEILYCPYNQLTNLNLNGLSSLQSLTCNNNQLPSLDINELSNLTFLNCSHNYLTSLLIKNNNDDLYVDFITNPYVTYICANQNSVADIQNRVTEYGYTNCVVNSSCNLSVEENPLATNFTIYPNPVDEVLNLTTKQDTEVYSLTIYNLLGQQVQTTTNPTNTVDVSSLKTGNYIVKVVTDKGVSSSKFVKE